MDSTNKMDRCLKHTLPQWKPIGQLVKHDFWRFVAVSLWGVFGKAKEDSVTEEDGITQSKAIFQGGGGANFENA